MTSPVTIVNLALGELAEVRINDFNEGTKLADIANEHYPLARDATLEAHPWDFNTNWFTLVQHPVAPLAKWGKQFKVPTDPPCLAIWNIHDDEEQWDMGLIPETKERVLFCDLSTVHAKCGFRVEDTTKWSALAVTALKFQLAASFAITLTGQSSKREQMLLAFRDSLPRAQARDSKAKRRQVPLPTTFSAGRVGRTHFYTTAS